MIYVFILLFKIIEVSIGTTRIVLITRGERVLGALIGVVEVLIWIALVSSVLSNVTEDPMKVVVYALGFGIGNYVGSLFEQKLGIGNMRVEAIVLKEDGERLASVLRTNGFAVTLLEGKGMSCDRHVLLMNIRRKNHQELIELIKGLQGNVVLTINDVRPVYGGYGILKR